MFVLYSIFLKVYPKPFFWSHQEQHSEPLNRWKNKSTYLIWRRKPSTWWSDGELNCCYSQENVTEACLSLPSFIPRLKCPIRYVANGSTIISATFAAKNVKETFHTCTCWIFETRFDWSNANLIIRQTSLQMVNTVFSSFIRLAFSVTCIGDIFVHLSTCYLHNSWKTV